jgi:hypothetical protein
VERSDTHRHWRIVSEVLQQKLIVIPGNPGSQSGAARPGIQEFQKVLDAGFHRHDGKGTNGFVGEGEEFLVARKSNCPKE